MKQRFEALDGFRGICALCVVVFHMPQLDSTITKWSFFHGSAIFVELFFILSGFVLAHGYSTKKELRFYSFAKSRFFRLYPLHLFMLVLTILMLLVRVIAIDLNLMHTTESTFSGANSLNEIIPNLLLVHAWTSYTSGVSFNYPSWSISIEFYVYFIFFFTIAVAKRHKLLSWGVLFVVSFLLLANQSDYIQETVLRGLSCFFGGSLGYALYKQIKGFTLSYLMGSLYELALLFCIYYLVQSSFEYKLIAAIALFFMVVLLFAFEAGVVSTLLKTYSLQLLGRLSYSIYMTHAAILLIFTWVTSAVESVYDQKLFYEEGAVTLIQHSVLNNVAVFTLILFIIGVSHFTYKYIEVRGQNLGRRYS
jgi:peptidoglycan/LPS O-acetylase OafA/YrhL